MFNACPCSDADCPENTPKTCMILCLYAPCSDGFAAQDETVMFSSGRAGQAGARPGIARPKGAGVTVGQGEIGDAVVAETAADGGEQLGPNKRGTRIVSACPLMRR